MPTKTLHGCTCLKDWVKIDGKKYSGCVYGQAAASACPMTTDKGKLSKRCPMSAHISSCPVEEGCGAREDHRLTIDDEFVSDSKAAGVLIQTHFWDICVPPILGGFSHPKIPHDFFKMSRSSNIKAIIGLILFLVCAGFIIPYVLYLMGFRTLVNVWIPNLDLIATVFAFKGGLFDSILFRFLYTETPSTTFGFWSRLIIKYFALLGLTLITAQMVWKRKEVSRGMSYALIMLLFSYFIPNALIETMMQKIYTYLDGKISEHIHSHKNRTQICILCGFLAVICFLLMERFFLNNHLHRIDNISSFLINKLWFFLGHKRIKKRKK